MTVYRKDLDAVSNWFNAQLEGIGHRGSSFTDCDSVRISALTHDGYSRRFLFQEFKRPSEECTTGQWWALYDLSRQPNTGAWLVQQRDGLEAVDLTVFREVEGQGLLKADVLSVADYRQRYADWWNQPPPADTADVPARLIWSEYLQRDPSLQAFVAGEIARAGIELQTAKDNARHYREAAERLAEKIARLQSKKRSA